MSTRYYFLVMTVEDNTGWAEDGEDEDDLRSNLATFCDMRLCNYRNKPDDPDYRVTETTLFETDVPIGEALAEHIAWDADPHEHFGGVDAPNPYTHQVNPDDLVDR